MSWLSLNANEIVMYDDKSTKIMLLSIWWDLNFFFSYSCSFHYFYCYCHTWCLLQLSFLVMLILLHDVRCQVGESMGVDWDMLICELCWGSVLVIFFVVISWMNFKVARKGRWKNSSLCHKNLIAKFYWFDF